MKFKKGIVVWLNSGGPPMTIKTDTDLIIGHKAWLCCWFENTTIKEAVFTEEQLTTEEPDFNL